MLSSIFESKMTTARGCYSIVDNGTCGGWNQLDDDAMVKQNAHYLSYTVLMVGFIFITTSSVLYTTLVKVFRSEHRNRKFI